MIYQWVTGREEDITFGDPFQDRAIIKSNIVASKKFEFLGLQAPYIKKGEILFLIKRNLG